MVDELGDHASEQDSNGNRTGEPESSEESTFAASIEQAGLSDEIEMVPLNSVTAESV